MENTDGIMILVINNTAPGFSLPEAWEAQLWPQIIHFPRVVTVFLPQAASKPCTYSPSFSCTVGTDLLSSHLFTNPVFLHPPSDTQWRSFCIYFSLHYIDE